MYYGEFAYQIDNKFRLILPAKFREVSQSNYIEKFIATRGLDGCIFLWPDKEWELQEQKFKALPFTKRNARHFNRILFSGAAELRPDKQGRVLLPGYLREYAGIRHDVMIVGISSRIEIWDIERWRDFYNTQKESFENTAEDLFDVS